MLLRGGVGHYIYVQVAGIGRELFGQRQHLHAGALAGIGRAGEMHAGQRKAALRHHIRGHRAVDAAGQHQRRLAGGGHRQAARTGLFAAVDIRRKIADLHRHVHVRVVHVHLEVGIRRQQHAAQLPGDLHAVHGERLVRALGAHLKRLCRPQRAAQVFLRGVRNDSKVLGAHGCAADGRDAENFADALLRRVDVLIARRLRVHRALRLVDFKIPQGFQAAAHGLEQHALEGGAVEPLQRHFALIGQNDLFHILQNSLSLK